MAVDLADLVDSLYRETSLQGTNIFGSEDTAVGSLRDAFWDLKLMGFYAAYTEADGLVSPIAASGSDLEREQQQLIILAAGIRAIRLQIKDTQTTFRAKAGPVEFETQFSASVLKEILVELQGKVAYLVQQLGGLSGTQTYYIDSLAGRNDSLSYGVTTWTGSDSATFIGPW